MNHRQTVLVLFIVVLMAGCGGDSNDPSSPPPGCPSIAGSYSMTIEASSICQGLPNHALIRTYKVTVTQTDCNVALDFEPGTVDNATLVMGLIANGILTLDVTVSDHRDAQSYLAMGRADLSPIGDDWEGNLNGTIEGDGSKCMATDHAFKLHRL